MPSTKRRASKKPMLSVPDKDIIDEFKRKVNSKILLSEQYLQRSLAVLDNAQESFLAMFSEADLKKTVGQIREENRLKEEAKMYNSALSKSTSPSKRKHSRDEGYITEGNTGSSTSSSYTSVGSLTANHMHPPRSVTRLSRGLSRSTKNLTSTTTSSGISSMGPPTSAYRGRPRRSSSTSAISKPMYRTPAAKKMNNFPPITPKVTPNTPITVLRRPRKGEMILSMSGSPLLQGSGVDEMASCNIPLEDGTLISLVPHKLRQSQFQLPMEYMGPDTYQQLAQLKNNIDIVCKMIAKNQST